MPHRQEPCQADVIEAMTRLRKLREAQKSGLVCDSIGPTRPMRAVPVWEEGPEGWIQKGWRQQECDPGPEFVCRGCFMRKAMSQRGITDLCVDCIDD